MKERDTAQSGERVAALIGRLGSLPTVDQLSFAGLKAIAAIRVLALCSRAERDPLLELTRRFGCLATARALIGFARQAAQFWPEDLEIHRPCCQILSPDELTLAQMVDAARAGDRAGFARLLDGLVRRDRHDPLFDRSAMLASLLV